MTEKDNSSYSILIVEDNCDFIQLLEMRLKLLNYRVFTASTGSECLQLIRQVLPNIVLLDIQLPDADGISLLETIKDEFAEIPVVMMTAFGSERMAVDCIKGGAYDYIKKPVDFDEFSLTVKRAIERSVLQVEIMRLKCRISRDNQFMNILGASHLMQGVFDQIGHVLDTDANVFIEGETGTGKELIARAIHFEGKRRQGPWITINCAAISENLFESELFGHVKGAFTGAIRTKTGKIQLADDGCLFLDEVSELSPALQPKLLRVIQDGTFSPVGSEQQRKVNVRFITATNTNIQQAIKCSKFRMDLYYRLAVITIKVPALRERAADILLLADSFLARYTNRYCKEIVGFTPLGRESLLRYSWPGNVRELENVIERSVIMSSGRWLDAGDLVLPSATFAELPENANVSNLPTGTDDRLIPYKDARLRFENDYLRLLLQHTKGNISQAAKVSGINRADLYRLLNRQTLNADDFRESP